MTIFTDEILQAFKLDNTKRDIQQNKKILNYLTNHHILSRNFSDNPEIIQNLAELGQYHFLQKKQKLFEINSNVQKFYILLEGKLESIQKYRVQEDMVPIWKKKFTKIYKQIENQNSENFYIHRSKNEQDDIFYGHYNLIFGMRSLSRVIASEDSHFLCVEKQDFTKIGLYKLFLRFYEEAYQSLSIVQSLENLTESEKRNIIIDSNRIILRKDDFIFHEGDNNTNVYFIQDGILTSFTNLHNDKTQYSKLRRLIPKKHSQENIQILNIYKGQIVGEFEIFNNQKQKQFSLKVMSQTAVVIRLTKMCFLMRLLLDQNIYTNFLQQSLNNNQIETNLKNTSQNIKNISINNDYYQQNSQDTFTKPLNSKLKICRKPLSLYYKEKEIYKVQKVKETPMFIQDPMPLVDSFQSQIKRDFLDRFKNKNIDSLKRHLKIDLIESVNNDFFRNFDNIAVSPTVRKKKLKKLQINEKQEENKTARQSKQYSISSNENSPKQDFCFNELAKKVKNKNQQSEQQQSQNYYSMAQRSQIHERVQKSEYSLDTSQFSQNSIKLTPKFNKILIPTISQKNNKSSFYHKHLQSSQNTKSELAMEDSKVSENTKTKSLSQISDSNPQSRNASQSIQQSTRPELKSINFYQSEIKNKINQYSKKKKYFQIDSYYCQTQRTQMEHNIKINRSKKYFSQQLSPKKIQISLKSIAPDNQQPVKSLKNNQVYAKYISSKDKLKNIFNQLDLHRNNKFTLNTNN